MQMFWSFLRNVCQGTANVYLYLLTFMFVVHYKLSLLPPFWLWYNLCHVCIRWNLLRGEEERIRNVCPHSLKIHMAGTCVMVQLIKTRFLIPWFCYSERYSWTKTKVPALERIINSLVRRDEESVSLDLMNSKSIWNRLAFICIYIWTLWNSFLWDHVYEGRLGRSALCGCLCIFLFPRVRKQEWEARMAELKARIAVEHLSYQAEFSRPNDIGKIITGFQRLIIKEEQFLACGHSFVMKKISISFQKTWGRKSIPCLIQQCLSQCFPNSPEIHPGNPLQI